MRRFDETTGLPAGLTYTRDVPTPLDTVTIVSSTNSPVLNGNTTIYSLNMQSGTLDLDGYELIINGDAFFPVEPQAMEW